jgi:hypothetical protein
MILVLHFNDWSNGKHRFSKREPLMYITFGRNIKSGLAHIGKILKNDETG